MDYKWLFFFLLFISRVLFFPLITSEEHQDSFWLLNLADSIKHFEYKLQGIEHDIYLPFYPFLIALTDLVFNNPFFSAKLVSLIFNILGVLFVYLSFKEVNKALAFPLAFVSAFNPLIWEYSIRVMTESVFFCLVYFCLFLFFKSLKNNAFLIPLGFFLSLSALTRFEAFSLIFAVVLVLFFRRKYSFYHIIFLFLLIAPVSLWWFRHFLVFNSFFPDYYTAKKEFSFVPQIWITTFFQAVPFLISILSIFGLSFNRKHLVFFLFFFFYSVFHLFFAGVHDRFVIPLIPIILFFFLNFFFKYFRSFISFICIALFLFSFPIAFSNAKLHGGNYDVIRESMEFLNSQPNFNLLAGDGEVYSFFYDGDVVPYGFANYYYFSAKELYPDIFSISPLLPYYLFMVEKNVHYWVVFDSLQTWYYGVSRNAVSESVIFKNVNITVSPLKAFERNNQTVLLYKVDWFKI